MTKLEIFQEILATNNIRICSAMLPICIDALSLKSDKIIVVNSYHDYDSCCLYCLLRHEKAHFDLNLFYGPSSSENEIKIIEQKVNREVAIQLIKEEELFDFLYVRFMPIWDIAEKLGVTEHIVKTAFDIYSVDEKWIARQNAIIWEWEA